MCEPVTATTAMYATLAASALSAGVSYYASEKQADAQSKYQKEMREQNIEASLDAYRFNTTQETTRMIQEDTAGNQEIQKSSLRRREAAGRALASSESAGVNLEALMGDFLRQEGDFSSSIQQQMDWKKQQSSASMKGYAAQAKNQIASYNPAPVQGPSLAGAVAGFGTSALGTYFQYKPPKADAPQKSKGG